ESVLSPAMSWEAVLENANEFALLADFLHNTEEFFQSRANARDRLHSTGVAVDAEVFKVTIAHRGECTDLAERIALLKSTLDGLASSRPVATAPAVVPPLTKLQDAFMRARRVIIACVCPKSLIHMQQQKKWMSAQLAQRDKVVRDFQNLTRDID